MIQDEAAAVAGLTPHALRSVITLPLPATHRLFGAQSAHAAAGVAEGGARGHDTISDAAEPLPRAHALLCELHNELQSAVGTTTPIEWLEDRRLRAGAVRVAADVGSGGHIRCEWEGADDEVTRDILLLTEQWARLGPEFMRGEGSGARTTAQH